MADLITLEFEVERRNILFKPTTSMPDATQLGYDGDPNLAVNGATPGQTLLYNSPIGTHYQRSSGDLFFKRAMPNVWVAIGSSSTADYRTVNTINERNNIPQDERNVGMLVYVNETLTIYQLLYGTTNDHWVIFSSAASGERYEPVAATNPSVVQPDPVNPTNFIIVSEPQCVFSSDGDVIMARVEY